MKRIFSVTLKRIGNTPHFHNAVTYQIVEATAKLAIDKATKQFKKESGWAAGVVVESLIHRGPAV